MAMTPPENDLRDAVADILLQELIVRRRYDSVGRAADWIDGKDIAVDRILSGPLAKARTDLERVTAERDAENTREFAARGQEPDNVWDFVRHVEEQCRTFIRERNEWKAVADTAEVENTRLKEEMEAATTRQSKIDFFGLALHSLGVGAPGMTPVTRDAIARNIALRIRSALSPKDSTHV